MRTSNREEGANRIVNIYENYVFKIPKDGEAVFQNKSEAYIWIYDYADCEFDWSLKNPEDLFINDLKKIK